LGRKGSEHRGKDSDSFLVEFIGRGGKANLKLCAFADGVTYRYDAEERTKRPIPNTGFAYEPSLHTSYP